MSVTLRSSNRNTCCRCVNSSVSCSIAKRFCSALPPASTSAIAAHQHAYATYCALAIEHPLRGSDGASPQLEPDRLWYLWQFTVVVVVVQFTVPSISQIAHLQSAEKAAKKAKEVIACF